MAAYATVQDVKARTTRSFTAAEENVMTALLGDAALLIDNCNAAASDDAKKAVSCRMVLRAMGDDGGAGIPIGASQGTVTAGPYSQTWTVGTGSAGELFLSRSDRAMLGAGNGMGVKNPLVDLLVPAAEQADFEPEAEPVPEPEPDGGQEPEDIEPTPAEDVEGAGL